MYNGMYQSRVTMSSLPTKQYQNHIDNLPICYPCEVSRWKICVS